MLTKHRKLLMQMPQDGSPVPARELAAKLGISSRSVINYVGELTFEHPMLIKATSKGYCLDPAILKQIQTIPADVLPETSEKRAVYMICRILENEKDPFSIMDFEDELFVGESTLRKDLPYMRKKLKEFDLFLNHQEGVLTITGEESNKRRMLSEVIYLEFNDNILSLASIEKAFPAYNAAALKELLLNVCNEYCYFINEFALMNLVLDLLISIDRIKNNHLTVAANRIYRFGNREQDLSRTIIRHLETQYEVVFNQLETDELTTLLFGRLTKIDYQSLSMENISQVVSQETLKIVELIKQELEVFEFLDFQNPELILFFTLHIDNLLKRLKNNYTTKNPLTEQIKHGCTFIYELSVLIAGIIKRETGYYVSQHETAYIAIHIGGMLQFQQSLRNKARCILVFPHYYDYASRLLEQLTQSFGTSLVFEDVVTRMEDIEQYGQIDMILTTIEIGSPVKSEVVPIHPFINDKDRTAIQNGLERVIRRKKLERTRENLLEISDPALFAFVPSFADEFEAIGFMAGEMIARGYAGESFLEAVYEREKSYSTAYADVAVPHSLQMNAKRTGMYICISSKPVPWGDSKVRIMLLFSVNPEDKNKFYDMFESLIVLLLEPVNMQRIAACSTYPEFVETLLQCLA